MPGVSKSPVTAGATSVSGAIWRDGRIFPRNGWSRPARWRTGCAEEVERAYAGGELAEPAHHCEHCRLRRHGFPYRDGNAVLASGVTCRWTSLRIAGVPYRWRPHHRNELCATTIQPLGGRAVQSCGADQPAELVLGTRLGGSATLRSQWTGCSRFGLPDLVCRHARGAGGDRPCGEPQIPALSLLAGYRESRRSGPVCARPAPAEGSEGSLETAAVCA